MNTKIIPESWIKTTIDQVCEINNGKTPKELNKVKNDGNIPFFKVGDMNNIQNDFFMNDSKIKLNKENIKRLHINIVQKDTIIFPKRGGAIKTNKKRILSKDSAYDTNIMGLTPILISSKFVFYYLSSFDLSTISSGSNVPQINNKDIEPLFFPLPPFNEQVRIVGRVEELFSQLDAAVRSLQTAQTQLEQYRQTTLKQAYTGKLTEKWRKMNLSKNESDFKEILNLKQRKDSQYNNVYNDFKFPDLPEYWTYVQMSKLVEYPKDDIVDGPFGSNLKTSDYTNSGVPIIRIQNVERNKFINKNIKYITKEKAEELKRHNYSKGQIVITKLGAPLGRTCIVPEYIDDGIIVADIVRIRNLNKLIDKKYLTYLFNSKIVINQLASKVKGTTRPRVNLTHIRGLQISICSNEEQKRIVEILEQAFSIVESLNLKEQINREKVLKQSILSQAFKGKLVPQDPRDESASVLLERIKAQKTKQRKLI